MLKFITLRCTYVGCIQVKVLLAIQFFIITMYACSFSNFMTLCFNHIITLPYFQKQCCDLAFFREELLHDVRDFCILFIVPHCMRVTTTY